MFTHVAIVACMPRDDISYTHVVVLELSGWTHLNDCQGFIRGGGGGGGGKIWDSDIEKNLKPHPFPGAPPPPPPPPPKMIPS